MGQNTVVIRRAPPLPYLLSTVKVVTLEKVCFGDTQNPKAVCSDIDCRWEALSADWRQFSANN